MTQTRTVASRQHAFRHEALLYAGAEEFTTQVSAFIDDAVAADEPILVVASSDKLARLPRSGRSGLVEFADMRTVGRNPARIIPAWSEFLSRHDGATVRGVGEPVTSDRDGDELVECQQLEALLNLAFADADGLWLVCPYDTATLSADVIAEAHRSHPVVRAHGVRSDTDTYVGRDAVTVLDQPLPKPHVTAVEHSLQPGRLAELRSFVAERSRAMGLDHERCDDLVVAANEIGSNSLMYGAGHASVRMWRDRSVICEIVDSGQLTDPLIGRRAPGHDEHDSRGIWMANQLCDLVQVRSTHDGTVVRLHMQVG